MISGCYQNNDIQADLDLVENFEYSPLRTFDLDFINLPQRMNRDNEITIDKDPFTLNHMQGIYNDIDVNVQINEERISAFDIDTLKMVGSVQYQSQRWGLIVAPNRKIYTVSVGQRLDHDLYLVTAITSDETYLLNLHSKSFAQNQQIKILVLDNNQSR